MQQHSSWHICRHSWSGSVPRQGRLSGRMLDRRSFRNELRKASPVKQRSARAPLLDRNRRYKGLVSTGADVRVKVDHGPRNSRFVFASLNVKAPVDVLWSSLTDYDHLDEFIPSLAENECLERKPAGAVLRQVGQQNIALGVKFCASAVLEIGEHLEGLSRELCWTGKNGVEWNEKLWYPSPDCIGGPSPRDITFELIEGDFQAFKGLWRMQTAWNRPEITRLSYSVFIRPMMWLPVGLIQGRIASEAKNNLRAVKRQAEKNAGLL